MGELGRHLFAKIMKATASDGTYSEIMKETVKSQAKYTDESFPPNETSLINDWEEDEVQDKVRLWRQFEWIRATEIEELNDEEGKLSVF
jgi:hypothetical protein